MKSSAIPAPVGPKRRAAQKRNGSCSASGVPLARMLSGSTLGSVVWMASIPVSASPNATAVASRTRNAVFARHHRGSSQKRPTTAGTTVSSDSMLLKSLLRQTSQ